MTIKRKRLLHVSICILFILIGVAVLIALMASKSHLEKTKPTTSAPLVRATRITTGPQSIKIKAEGTVRPLREIQLVPQVGGKVIYISPALVDGGECKKGDDLLTIDPVDYKLAVTLAKAKVKDSESNLKIIQEEAEVAKEEWRDHHAGNSHTRKTPPPLVAKEPQMAAAQARLEADRADLKKALLNLDRTTLRAPFEGRVGKKYVDVGQYVAPGQQLATLYSTEAAEIPVPLENETLYWFDVPGFTPGDGPGSFATIKASIAGRSLVWKGRVVRAKGQLDEKTRMITVVVRVDKPYGRKPPLAIGLFTNVEIEGQIIPEAALIPRAALHQGNIVWVVNDDGILRFRTVEIAHYQGESILIQSGLNTGDLVVTSSLKAVTDGMKVRTAVKEEHRE